MLSFPVNVALTVAFGLTGAYCLVHLITSRRRILAGTGPRTLTDAEVVDLNHGLMSAAMILMTWVMIGDAALWALVALFVVLAVSLSLNWRRAGSTVNRVDVGSHVLLDVAMIWMLVAMPLLMAGSAAGHDHGGHAHHGDHGAAAVAAATPAWAHAINLGFVGLCAAAALWWLGRTVTGRRHRLHAGCHTVMAAGMGVMLVAMSA
ncbi:DUF5134 domain-containing protein [Granulicoccus phenolivorans]|uniref:DUF5134 domain-containing protein n=1 Tax=Granulicoccus phenolivorans TaxID=266854 RepID=UPI00040E7F77|nr:DUF5134 domain-containing protein [Granulicoccus phenolivorans]